MVRDFQKEGAVVAGVSPDSVTSHAAFAAKHGLAVELLSDPDHKALTAYGVWQEKKMYGKAFMGVVRATVLIDPRGIVADTWENVRVNGHAAAVLETLRRLKPH
jgi:peroxiredoxin Q/BCP